ncbi:MAG TPA: sigma-70 family RNA polymerase sigma factor [Candidatus Elarobacter sp.]|nr:sigma-70 family RNA polymerase sigma factor [Candidatus Elarobacter sp.]
MPTSSPAADVSLWYERYSPSLRSIAARVTGDPDDADDALHDTFVAAWLFRGRFDDARNPLPWLATIAKRKALTIVSRRARVRRGAAQPVAPSAEDDALRLDADAVVRELVRAEPALALHALSGLAAREVGELLGVPMRTAASRIARGRRRVRTILTATTPLSARSKAPWSNFS